MTSPLTDEQLKDMLAGCEGEMLPCPFCGGTRLIVCDSGFSGATGPYAVSCLTKNCHGVIWALSFHNFKTRKAAIRAWNERAIPFSSLITELLELRAERGKE